MISFINSDTVNINMTHLQGRVVATYDELVSVFGDPTYGASEDNKVDTEWTLEFNTDTESESIVATIYNWKTNGTPCGEYSWHVGGKDNRAVEIVQTALDKVPN